MARVRWDLKQHARYNEALARMVALLNEIDQGARPSYPETSTLRARIRQAERVLDSVAWAMEDAFRREHPQFWTALASDPPGEQ